MFLKKLIPLIALLFVGCGGGGSSSSPQGSESAFRGLELYGFKLNFVDHRLRYDMDKIDSIDNSLTHYYFDFGSDDYGVDTKDKQIFIDGKRGALADIAYELDSQGQIVAKASSKKLFELALLEQKKIKADTLEEYGSSITIDGEQYSIKQSYLSNFHIIKDLTSNDTFDSLSDFTAQHQTTPFTGGGSTGLVFADDDKLQERNSTNGFVDAGTYKIEKIDAQEILFIYPDNIKRYGDDCYILDFSRVWKSECHRKGEKEEIYFYDKAVYDAVEQYMQTAFVDVDISI